MSSPGPQSILLLAVLGFPLAGVGQDPVPAGPERADAEVSTARGEVAAADREHGPRSRRAAVARKTLATALWTAGRIPEAATIAREAVEILEADPSAKRSHLAILRSELAIYLCEDNRQDEALSPARAAAEDAAEAFGERHPRTASLWYVLGGIQMRLGLMEDAEASTLRALAIQRELPGDDRKLLFRTLTALAQLRTELGRYSEAREALSEATRIAEGGDQVSADDQASCAAVTGNLEMYLGRPEEARRHFERGIALLEAGGRNRPKDQLTASVNLSMSLWVAGRHDEARAVLAGLASEVGRIADDDVPVPVWNGIASVAQMAGDHVLSERAARTAEARERSRPAPDPVALGLALLHHGAARVSSGKRAEALAILDEASACLRRALGDSHRHTATALRFKARALAALGRNEAARSVLREALAGFRASLHRTTAALSEPERLSSLGKVRDAFDEYLSLAVGDPGQIGAVADEVLAWKGQVLRSLHADRAWLRAHADRETAVILSRLARVSDALAPERLLAGPERRPGAGPEKLIAERERLERELLARRPARPLEESDAAAVSGALGPEEALVDYLAFVAFGPPDASGHRPREPRVLATVLRRGRPPAVFDLGPAPPARDAVAAHVSLVSRSTRPSATAGGHMAAAAAAARAAVWDPLAASLDGVRRVFVVPDTFLAALPLETLPGREAGRYLIEDLEFVYLPHAQARLLAARPPAGRGALLVGAIDYGAPAAAADAENPAFRDALGFPLRDLPKSAEEIEFVAAALERGGVGEADVVRLTGANATEAAVRGCVSGRRFVHLATHGLFAPEDRDGTRVPAGRSTSVKTALAGQVPLLRAAVALAGANGRAAQGGDDGLLTAAEAAWLDLGGCELVTVSACESGLGAARGGESLLGLRRSLDLAGARARVTALWRVGDADAAELMREFYGRLLEGGTSKSAALRGARLALLDRRREESGGQGLPGAWGAFILDGDWR